MNIPENFDRWMFDYKEGNLSGSEMETFENFLIQNPEFEVEADAWSNAFVGDEQFTYPNQASLEKDRKVVPLYIWSSAALLLALIGVSSLLLFSTDANSVDGFTSDNNWGNNSPQMNLTNSNNNNTPKINILNDISDADENALSIAPNLSNTYSFGNNSNATVNPNQTFIVSNDLNNDFVNAFDNSVNNNGNSTVQAFNQELNKLDEIDNSSEYKLNPELQDLDFDVSKVRSNHKYRSFGTTMKQFYKKIEKMLDAPIGLTNLRDPNLGIAQNSILSSNPGFTGGMLAPRFEMNYRNQWLNSDMSSQEMTMSFDNYSYQMRGGVGVMLNVKDYGMGAYGDYNVSLLYSPKFVINRNVVFEPAIKMTMGVLTANSDKLTSNSAIEFERGRLLNTGSSSSQLTGAQQLWYKDYGLGFVLNTKWFYIGFSADNLANHYENVFSGDEATPTKTPVQMNAVVGFDYESERSKNSIKINRSVSPYLVYNQLGTRKNLWAGVNLRLDWLTIGGSYSISQEYSATLGVQLEKFKLIYRYDMTESLYLNDKIASHNVGIRFNATRKKARLH